MGSLWSRNSPSTHPGLRTIAGLWRLRKVRIDVRRLRHATLIHVALLGELARRLVPPHRSSFALLAHQIRLLAQELAHELGVLGFVMAAGQHHGAVPIRVKARGLILSSPAPNQPPGGTRTGGTRS